MPYHTTWKKLGFKPGVVYTYYDFTVFQRKILSKIFGTFCTGDMVSFTQRTMVRRKKIKQKV